MSTYKVIQDIEAEDKLLGPLTLRQFIFAIVAVMFYYFCYLLISKHAAFLVIAFLPPALFMTFFAIPFGGDQPTEIWALAKIRFWFKPRRRIWDQSGAKELVTINAPKKVEEVRTNGLSQTEIRSRLSALADTIDSRGWAVKNVNLNLSVPTASAIDDLVSDRLIGAEGLPQEVPSTDIEASDDILDEQNNPIAHQFEQMITASTKEHRKQIMDMMTHRGTPSAGQTPAAAAAAGIAGDNWFLSQPVQPPQGQPTSRAAVTTPVSGAQAVEPTAEEEQFAQRLKAEKAMPTMAYAHLKTIQPLGSATPPAALATPAPVPATDTTALPAPAVTDDTKTQVPPIPQAVTAAPNPAILELANNNDLNVATLARQAQKTNTELPDDADGEVVIALR